MSENVLISLIFVCVILLIILFIGIRLWIVNKVEDIMIEKGYGKKYLFWFTFFFPILGCILSAAYPTINQKF